MGIEPTSEAWEATILMAKGLGDDLLYNEQGNEALLIKCLDKTH